MNMSKIKLHLTPTINIIKEQIQNADISNTAIVMAYYFLLSLFPLLIALGNTLPYFRIDPNVVLPYIKELMPSSIYVSLKPAIQSLLTQNSGGLLSLSAITAIWSASQSINAIQSAMNKVFNVDNRRNFLITRFTSLIVIILLLIAIIVVITILGLGRNILNLIQPIFKFQTGFIDYFQTLKWPLTFIILLAIMYSIYYIVPNIKLSFQSVFPGALFSTIGWMILSQVFGLYIKYFNSKIASYQIIGSFIVLMLWLNIASLILIIGSIINSIFYNRNLIC